MLAFFQNLKEFLIVVFVIMIEGFRRKYSAVFKIGQVGMKFGKGNSQG